MKAKVRFPKGSAAFTRYDTSSCQGAFAVGTACMDSFSNVIRDSHWVPADEVVVIEETILPPPILPDQEAK